MITVWIKAEAKVDGLTFKWKTNSRIIWKEHAECVHYNMVFKVGIENIGLIKSVRSVDFLVIIINAEESDLLVQERRQKCRKICGWWKSNFHVGKKTKTLTNSFEKLKYHFYVFVGFFS